MPTPTYDLISSASLITTSKSLDFTGIPGTYRDLILVIQASHDNANNSKMRFNNNNSGYSRVIMTGTGTSATTGATTTDTELPIASSNVGDFLCIVHIFDYAQTDKHTTVVARNNYPTKEVDARVGRWANTAAVTQINLFTNSTWGAGSSFYLYGIAG